MVFFNLPCYLKQLLNKAIDYFLHPVEILEEIALFGMDIFDLTPPNRRGILKITLLNPDSNNEGL